jgi:hypothetical protein
MNSELEKPPHTVDGFHGYEDGVEGGEERANDRIIQGTLVRFTNEASWATSDGEEVSADLELVAIDIIRVVQRWHDAKPLETRVLKPGEKFPDVNALNAAVPQKEWTEGPDGRPRGPCKHNISSTCSIHGRWANTRMPPAPSAARSPFAILSIAPTGCVDSAVRTSIR